MNIVKKLFSYTPKPSSEPFVLSSQPKPEYDLRNELRIEKAYVSSDIDENRAYIRKRFRIPINNDVIMRDIALKNGKSAFILFYDGMVIGEFINDNIIQSLLELTSSDTLTDSELYKRLTANSQAAPQQDMDIIADEVNFGSCALFVDGTDTAFLFDVRGWEHRGIDKPENEQSIYGPQEAFSEMLRTNTALLRKSIKTEGLIARSCILGSKSKTKGILLYIDDIANEKLIHEAMRRLNGIKADYIMSIEQVQNLIVDKPMLFTPQLLATERPDRAARALTEGRCVFILNGSPRALIMPSGFFELTHSASDEYLAVPYVTMSRVIRLIGMVFSLLLPAIYLAMTLYHQEIIPTYLLYSISASRENVPFPSIVEMLLMDISFELIREAGLRMPSPIGSTLGIVGGLILGQAAVSAKIVSPIMIIVIAITGIGSFETADYTLGWAHRLLRLAFILVAAVYGFFGIAACIVLYSLYLGSLTTFGIPYVSPVFAFRSKSMVSPLVAIPTTRRERRPGYLRTKRPDAAPPVSRRWQIKNKGE
ncbi:MAG: spore germination protein [Clostridia bacterium]|nr:spore germination protein [Clostridia bacterium]